MKAYEAVYRNGSDDKKVIVVAADLRKAAIKADNELDAANDKRPFSMGTDLEYELISVTLRDDALR